MTYSEKKAVEEFFMRVIESIERDMHSYNHVATVTHNAKVEIIHFLDDDLSYKNVKCFKE